VTASKALPATAAQETGGRISLVARQPILTADEKVFGYELLFRDGVEDYFREVDSDSASRRTLDTSLQIGLETLCDGRRGFVNCTRDVLLKDYMTLLPSPLAVVEVLESVPPDDLVLAGLKRLKEAPWRCRMLAEKGETRGECTAAKAAGFIYFQGYFFAVPKFFTRKKYPLIASIVCGC